MNNHSKCALKNFCMCYFLNEQFRLSSKYSYGYFTNCQTGTYFLAEWIVSVPNFPLTCILFYSRNSHNIEEPEESRVLFIFCIDVFFFFFSRSFCFGLKNFEWAFCERWRLYTKTKMDYYSSCYIPNELSLSFLLDRGSEALSLLLCVEAELFLFAWLGFVSLSDVSSIFPLWTAARPHLQMYVFHAIHWMIVSEAKRNFPCFWNILLLWTRQEEVYKETIQNVTK